MKKTLFLSALALMLATVAHGANCELRFLPESSKLTWTAYKTTKKVPVSGTFNKVLINGELKAGSVEQFLSSVLVAIDSESVNTDVPARDNTIFTNFFKLASGGKWIRAIASEFKDGRFKLDVSMNDKTVSIPMKIAKRDKGHYELSGSLNVLRFRMNDALESLNKACFEVHKGSDGVSKTWNDVDLKYDLYFEEKCDT